MKTLSKAMDLLGIAAVLVCFGIAMYSLVVGEYIGAYVFMIFFMIGAIALRLQATERKVEDLEKILNTEPEIVVRKECYKCGVVMDIEVTEFQRILGDCRSDLLAGDKDMDDAVALMCKNCSPEGRITTVWVSDLDESDMGP